MKLLKILILLFLLALIALSIGVYMASNYVSSPEFKTVVTNAARQQLGAHVEISDVKASLWEGVTLKGIAFGNPPGFDGHFLTADGFVLRYDLWPLLKKEISIQQLSIHNPVITLSRNAEKVWNYEKIGSATPPAATPSTPPPSPSPSTSSGSSPIDISLSKLSLENGEIAMLDEKKAALLRILGLNFNTAVKLQGSNLTGDGTAWIKTINCADSLFVHNITSAIHFLPGSVKLAPLAGKLAEGDVTGDITVQITGGAKYFVNLNVENSSVPKILVEAGAKPIMSGRLKANTSLEGTGGLETISGKGTAEIVNGQLLDIPLLNLLAVVLQVKELNNLQFGECRLEFTIANNAMQTSVIALRSPKVQLAGSGTVSLADYSLNHTLTLALHHSVASNMPKEIRGIFTQREDGLFTLDFKVWGPYDAPKTDIAERLAKGAVNELLQKGMQKLFR